MFVFYPDLHVIKCQQCADVSSLSPDQLNMAEELFPDLSAYRSCDQAEEVTCAIREKCYYAKWNLQSTGKKP